MPSLICANCLVQVQQAYTFKQQVENADITLKQYVLTYKPEEPKIDNIKLGKAHNTDTIAILL